MRQCYSYRSKITYITSFSKVAYLGRKCNDFADIIVLFNKKSYVPMLVINIILILSDVQINAAIVCIFVELNRVDIAYSDNFQVVFWRNILYFQTKF